MFIDTGGRGQIGVGSTQEIIEPTIIEIDDIIQVGSFNKPTTFNKFLNNSCCRYQRAGMPTHYY